MSHKKSTSDRSTPTKSLDATMIKIMIEQLVVNILVTYKVNRNNGLVQGRFLSNKHGNNSDVNLDFSTTLKEL